MKRRLVSAAGLSGLLIVASLAPALAQSAEPSMTCRLFPLACPQPVAPPPPPLLGPPEDQAAMPANEKPMKKGHRAPKHMAHKHKKM